MTPDGLPVVLDPRVRRSADGRVLLGGDPGRLLRLGPSGPSVVDGLAAGRPAALGRTLLDGGLAHPHPAPVAVRDVAVVVPVRDRADELDGCLAALGSQAPVMVVDDGSRDPDAVAVVASRHGATLLRRPQNGGPAAARNTGLAQVGTELVAFVDSDCRPAPDWLARLLGHFADPAVAAVAPRVVGRAVPGADAAACVAATRSPLDLGEHPARVRPGTAVAYVPTAALVVRRAALQSLDPGGFAFDERLRYGEDVDLVWRLHDAGWTVRYDPSVVVEHLEPASWMRALERRFRYGTSAGPLAQRHGERLTHLVLSPWPSAAVALALVRRPGLGLAASVIAAARLKRKLDGLPASTAPRLVADGVGATALQLGRVLGTLAPVLPLLPGLPRSARARALLLLVAPHLVDWARRRPPVDPAAFTAVRLAEEASYGLGVWVGALRARTAAPLVPRWKRPD